MSNKKVVSRNMFIAVGLICIVLVVGLAGAVANYTSMLGERESKISDLQNKVASDNSTINSLQEQIAEDNSSINSLNSQVTELQDQVGSLNSQISTLQTQAASDKANISSLQSQVVSANSQITSLQNQVNNLAAITNMAASATWVNNEPLVQPANTSSSWTFSASYAGEVHVTVNVAQPYSSPTNIYVKLSYWSLWLQPNYNADLGPSGGIAVFPVVSTSPIPVNLLITVGNANSPNPVTMTVTITYVY